MHSPFYSMKLLGVLSLALGLFIVSPALLRAEINNPLLRQVTQPSSEKQNSPAAPLSPTVDDSSKTGLSAFYSWAGTLPKDLIDLKNRVDSQGDLSSIEAKLPEISSQIGVLQAEADKLQDLTSPQYLDIDNLQIRLDRLLNRLEKLNVPVTKTIADLSALREQWTANKQQLADFVASKDMDLALTAEQQQDARQNIETAIGLIEQALAPLLNLGKQIGEQQVRLYTIKTVVRQSHNDFRQVSIHQTSPSMLSGEFYQQINPALLAQIRTNLERTAKEQLNYFRQHLSRVILLVMILLATCVAVYWTRKWITPVSRWHPFAHCPLATSVFFLAISHTFISYLPIRALLPSTWETFLHMLAIIAVIRLATRILADQWSRRLLTRLAQFMVITLLLITLEIPEPVILLFAFYASIVALLYYAAQLRGIRNKSLAEFWARTLWGIFPLMILFFGAFGYDQVALIVFSTLLATVVTCLSLWMLYMLDMGLLDLGLTALPFAIIRDNKGIIVHRLRWLIIWLHLLLLGAVLGVVWGLYPTVNAAISGLNHIGFNVGSSHIGPGLILTLVFIIYGVILFSKALQALLLKEVLPRYAAEQGVRLSITRLVHYAVLIIGFLFLLNILGFELKQLALIGGALGLGISFGLQSIINNFASGLILLFERPIKVGDTIQIGDEQGEVKKLGLRATIIQTYDNAEIVIPNSDLITGQVTNWTLADRQVRVKVPIGVAYGTDVTTVTTILTTCAKNNPMVLTTPKPVALFLAFGASSLDFELRVWIPDINDKLQVLSDLNTDIESEFEAHSIEIPFPQSDLHIRSIAPMAGRVFKEDSLVSPEQQEEEIEPPQTDHAAPKQAGP